jgi:hypothetical protein
MYFSISSLTKMVRLLVLLSAAAGISGCNGVSNEPVAKSQLAENVLFSSYQESPKYLDSTDRKSVV